MYIEIITEKRPDIETLEAGNLEIEYIDILHGSDTHKTTLTVADSNTMKELFDFIDDNFIIGYHIEFNHWENTFTIIEK